MWPKLAAIAIALLVWQIVVWSGWKEPWVLPGPVPVFQKLFEDIADGTVFDAIGLTMRRAAVGFALATVVGGLIGIAVARVRVLRVAVGSLITGLQTMPSIAWFPLAILLFKLSESAILFVIVLGAAPSIANGIISGIDTVPPLLDRVGTVLGASGFRRLRHVVIPAALPQVVAGMKQGWAFAWRSLMAGELLVIIANKPSIGTQLQNARDLADTTWLISVMIVILVIGIVIDTIFGTVERTLLRRRGLATSA
jgi:NitT/TauT family transport system permease protein